MSGCKPDLQFSCRLLSLHIVRVRDVLPPVVVDPVPATHCLGEVVHPPHVMLADVAAAPFGGGHLADDALEIGEVVQPVVALAQDGGWVVPVVVAGAVRRKVDVAAGGLAGVGFFMASGCGGLRWRLVQAVLTDVLDDGGRDRVGDRFDAVRADALADAGGAHSIERRVGD